MKDWIEVVKVFGYVWLTAAVLLLLANIVGTWIIGGSSAVQQSLSALKVVNFILTVITVAPGMGALAWAEKLKAKSLVAQRHGAPRVAIAGSAANRLHRDKSKRRVFAD